MPIAFNYIFDTDGIGQAQPFATNGVNTVIPATQAPRVRWEYIPDGAIHSFSADFQPHPLELWKKVSTSKSESSRSSSGLQDLAYQIEESVASLSQELGEQEATIEEIDTKLEVSRESCSLIRGRISNLQKVANQLRTMTGTEPQLSSWKIAAGQQNFGQQAEPAPQTAEAEVQQAEPALWQQGLV